MQRFISSRCNDSVVNGSQVPRSIYTLVRSQSLNVVSIIPRIFFCRATNAILAKIENHNNKPVTLNLISSIALPVLTYSLEAVALNKSELTSLNHPWVKSFQKVFNAFDKNVVKQCQLFNGYLSISHYYGLKSMLFLSRLDSSPSLLMRHIGACAAHEDAIRLACMFGSNATIFAKNYKKIM